MLRVAGKPQGGLMQERWIDGTWLGLRWSSQEHLVARACDGVVVRSRAVREVPRPVTMEALDKIVGLPHAPQGVAKYKKQEVPRGCQVQDPQPLGHHDVDLPLPVPRSVYVTKDMLRRFGYTMGCPKCILLQRGVPPGAVGHSLECRNTMTEKMKGDQNYQN